MSLKTYQIEGTFLGARAVANFSVEAGDAVALLAAQREARKGIVDAFVRKFVEGVAAGMLPDFEANTKFSQIVPVATDAPPPEELDKV